MRPVFSCLGFGGLPMMAGLFLGAGCIGNAQVGDDAASTSTTSSSTTSTASTSTGSGGGGSGGSGGTGGAAGGASARAVLFGGETGGVSGTTYLGDTWEWDGARWT